MANMIIKPAADGNLLIQDRAGGAVLSTGTSGATLANGLALGTPASIALTNATGFPAGHVIKTSVTGDNNVSSDVGTIGSTSMVDSGIDVSHVPALTSSNSFLVVEFFSSNFYIQSAASVHHYDCTMRTVSNGTYTAGESIVDASQKFYIHHFCQFLLLFFLWQIHQ